MQIPINTSCSISYRLLICYKTFDNPSSIDLFQTYYGKGYKCTRITATGISSFWNFVVTLLREKCNCLPGKIMPCRNSEKFKNANFIDNV